MIEEDVWGEEEQPWLENDGFVQTLIDKVDFLDILDKYKLDYQKTGSSNSSHKLRCPFPQHLDGAERTPSLHISAEDNVFKCFGCNAGGTIIDFVMLYRGMPKYRAIREVAQIAGITDTDIDEEFVPVYRNPEETILAQVYKSNVLIREFLESKRGSPDYDKWERRADKWLQRLHHYILDFEDDQWEVVQEYYNRIRNFLVKQDK